MEEIQKPSVVVGTPATEVKKTAMIQVNLNGTVLDVVDPQIRDMFAEPKPTDSTMIASLLSRCVVPVKMGVFQIPEKLLGKLTGESECAETMLPLEFLAIRRELQLFSLEAGSTAKCVMSDDPVDQFTFEAIDRASRLIKVYLVHVVALCQSLKDIQQRYASESSFYLNQTLGAQGSQMPIKDNVIMTPIQSFIMELNRLSMGLGGYRILAMLKAIDKVGKFLSDARVKKIFGADNAVLLLNKLDYRIYPEQVMLHEDLGELMRLVTKVGTEGVKAGDAAKLIVLADGILSNLKTL